MDDMTASGTSDQLLLEILKDKAHTSVMLSGEIAYLR